MQTLIIISLVLLVSYIVVTSRITGSLPSSLSNTFYTLNNIHPHYGAAFTAICWITAFSMMPVLLQESDGKWFQFMAFFAVCALAFVGAAPHFKGFDRPVHMTAAALCAINLITWAILMGFWLVVALYVSLLIIIVFAFKQQHHRMFWAEMACFAAAYHVCIYLAF